MRTWLYRIATNVCLTAAERRGWRPLPSGLGGPGQEPEEMPSGISWLQPIPDELVNPESEDPAAIVAARDGLRLALIASLQYLPARQRAVLILRDVLAWPAAEVAEVVGMTTTAVKSVLQRARARIEEVAPTADEVVEPTESDARRLLGQYIDAFEKSDAAALARLLHKELALEMPPSPTWFAGDDAMECARQGLGSPGDWRMVSTMANGQPAAAAYRLGEDGIHRAYGIAVLTLTSSSIARIVVFADPGLLATFGLPLVQPADSGYPN